MTRSYSQNDDGDDSRNEERDFDPNARVEQDALEPDVESPLDGTMTPELRKLQEERDALYDRLARATADFKNSQRRLEQDKEQAIQYANSQLVKSLLPVIDNLERALAVDLAKTDAAAILKGMQIVHDQWMDVLRKLAVEPIVPQPGEHFDPAHHEALMHQPSDEYSPGTVTQVLQKGYVMHGRTLRPAGVVVAKET